MLLFLTSRVIFNAKRRNAAHPEFSLVSIVCHFECSFQSVRKNECRSLVPLPLQSLLYGSWGQDGGTLASVCASSSVDVVVIAFLNTFFGTDGLPEINLASSCNGPAFPGTNLLQCTQVGYGSKLGGWLWYSQDIKTCQAAGKIVLLSLGGAVGNYGFSSASQATTFATTLWNIFGGGTSSTRPFGASVVDGFDLGIGSGCEGTDL